ncbi:MAG: hypothetical protein AABZ32_07880 [Bacteroidota bacterium]
MKTFIVNIPEKLQDIFLILFRKFQIKSHALTEQEKEDLASIKWIEEDKSEDEVSKEKFYSYLAKHGGKI